jgi:hypothetical protein
MAENKQAPDTKSKAWNRQKDAVTIVRDTYAGPLHIRSEAETYLPAFPREDPLAYRDRLNATVFYDATARTINGLTGMVFRHPPQLSEKLPPEIAALWENIDARGTHGDVFCQQRHRDGEIDGHFCIFVDMQRVPEGAVRTRAEEQAAGLRPYWVGIQKQDVYGAREEEIGGRMTLTHFRYGEKVTEPDGPYGEKEVERVREYNLVSGEGGRRVAFTIHAKRTDADNKTGWVIDDEGIMSIDEIPVSIGYLGERVGLLESKPPHLALALENVRHYQLVSDNDNCLHIASVPWPAFIGVDPDAEIAIGPNMGVKLPAGADVKIVEPEGNGLEAMERRIAKSEHRMAILGLSLLYTESRAPETATSKRIDKAESDSTLSNHARASQDAFEEALRLTAKWLGIALDVGGEDRWIELNRDFESLPLDPQSITALSNMVAAGQLTLETLWDVLERGEILPSTFDGEVERMRLEGEGMRAPALVREPEQEAA